MKEDHPQTCCCLKAKAVERNNWMWHSALWSS